MFTAVIKKLVPGPLRRKAISAMEERMRGDRADTLKTIPRIDLKTEHLTNVRVLPDRLKLLELLPRDAVAAEIGVSQGHFTNRIVMINAPRKLHLVDAWDSERYNTPFQNKVEQAFSAQISAGTVEINKGYSTTVGKTFADGYFDWVYIDTDHSYLTTKLELEIFAPKMKPGGIMCGHDYSMGNWRDGIKYGVIEAVHEFCNTHGWEMIYVTLELINTPSFAIRKL